LLPIIVYLTGLFQGFTNSFWCVIISDLVEPNMQFLIS